MAATMTIDLQLVEDPTEVAMMFQRQIFQIRKASKVQLQ